MLRLLGALLLAGGVGALGFSAAAQLGRRCRALRALLGALELIERELSFRLAPMPELLVRLERAAAPPADRLFAYCRDGLGDLDRVPLAQRWREGLRDPALLLNEEERALLDELGEVLGRYDGEGQLEAIARTRAQLAPCADRAREEREKLGRMYRVLGVTAGAFLVILLL